MIRSRIKSALRHIGWEVSRYCPENSRICRSGSRLKALNVDLVLDVGANVGQFAQELRESGYEGRIISFEPLSKAYRDLIIASSVDPMWQIAPRCALGSSPRQSDISIASNSWSSSLLPMTEKHVAAAPNAQFIGTETVSISTLDELVLEDVRNARHPYLKIDTQGYEGEVLAGAKDILPHLVGLQLELSLVPLYEGQPDYIEMIQRIQEKGFELFGLDPEFYDARTSRLLQVDAIFCRQSLKV
ncbi:MAG TPA: FkbM family methyltransferase [Rhodocyclaceae bacterium]